MSFRYDKKKPIKLQMEAVRKDPGMMKFLLDDYIVQTLARHTDRDLITLGRIKDRTDEKARLQKEKEKCDETTELYKRVVRRLNENK